MSDSLPNSEIILYQTEDGRTRIQCRFENETIWLTQAQMANLFQTTPQNVTIHLRAIFAEGELVEAATCKDYLQVRTEGGREVSRLLQATSSSLSPLRSDSVKKCSFGNELYARPHPNAFSRSARARMLQQSICIALLLVLP